MFVGENDKVNQKDVEKLVNLSENYSVGELVDNCLAKNLKKTIKILNENKFGSDDCILILRTHELGLMPSSQELHTCHTVVHKLVLYYFHIQNIFSAID